MLDREIGLPGPHSSASRSSIQPRAIARIELERNGRSMRSPHRYPRRSSRARAQHWQEHRGHRQRPAMPAGPDRCALPAVYVGIICPAADVEMSVTCAAKARARTVVRVALDRLARAIRALRLSGSFPRTHGAAGRADRDRRRSGRSSAARPNGGSRPPAMPAR